MPLRILITTIVLISCAPVAPTSRDRVSHLEYLNVKVGMTVAEASNASGLSLSPGYELRDEEFACHYVSPNHKDSAFYFMVVDGLIARVDVVGENIITLSGVGVGSTELEVKEAYPGRVDITSHPYTGPEGHYLTIEIEDDFAIIFETDGQTVESYRAGADPAVRWIEGCS